MKHILQDLIAASFGARPRDLFICAYAAVCGGQDVQNHYEQGDTPIYEKKRGDLVTDADLASNKVIEHLVRDLAPNDAILSEESPPMVARENRGRLWIVDPLDGTNDFIARTGEFSVMIGLVENHQLILGAVYKPVSHELFLGGPGLGAFVIRTNDLHAGAVPLSAQGPRLDPPTLLISRSHPDARTARLIEELPHYQPRPCGSVGVKCAEIALGHADLYAHPVPFLKEWDTCAPEAILRGAGGKVSDCTGQPLTYGKANPLQPLGILAATTPAFESALPITTRIVTETP